MFICLCFSPVIVHSYVIKMLKGFQKIMVVAGEISWNRCCFYYRIANGVPLKPPSITMGNEYILINTCNLNGSHVFSLSKSLSQSICQTKTSRFCYRKWLVKLALLLLSMVKLDLLLPSMVKLALLLPCDIASLYICIFCFYVAICILSLVYVLNLEISSVG